MDREPRNAEAVASKQGVAFLVIDVQRGLFSKSTSVYRAEQMLENINALIARARRAGAVVVFIQHADKRTLVKGSEAWQLHPELHPVAGDRSIHKNHSSAFRETSLDQMLVEGKVGRVVVTGLVTHGCVKNACQDALSMGYEVVLVSDGHSSYSKQAPKMIHKWHQKLAEAGVEIVPAHEIAFGQCGLEDA